MCGTQQQINSCEVALVLWPEDYCVLFYKIKVGSYLSLNTLSHNRMPLKLCHYHAFKKDLENILYTYTDSKCIYIVGTDPLGKSGGNLKG